MNGEVDCQRVLERQYKGITYIITLKADPEGLSLQFENKYTGDAWQCYYEYQMIEQITTKAGSIKKYNKFIDMLVKALPENFISDGFELSTELLTHQDLQNQSQRKSTARTTDPKLITKRYLILSYISTYDKAHYPIPLEFIAEPDPQKLKLAIRRLAQELQYCESNPKFDDVIKEVSVLRHENQLIKSKLKSVHRQESKENFSNNSSTIGFKELEEQNQKLKQELAVLKLAKDQELGKKNKIIQEKDKKIKEYEEKIRQMDSNNNQYDQYEEKFGILAKQTSQMASALQHSKQNEKKSQLKIVNLEKELQKMMNQLKKKNHIASSNIPNSPRRSDNGSVHSHNSNKRSTQNKSNKKPVPRKNSSIYDSDTQSSKMRKETNSRVSPYRQTTRPLNTSNSAKKKQTQRNVAISKYSNISNLYGKDRTRNRSRSKSKSVKKQLSPPSDNFESSAVLTEGLGYPSDDEEDNRVSDTMARLQNYKKRKAIESQGNKSRGKEKQKKMSMNPIQQKISSIASMMRNFKNNRTNAQLLDNQS